MYVSTLGAVIYFVFLHLISLTRFFERSEELWKNEIFHVSLFEALQVNRLTPHKTELESQRRDALSGQSCELSVAKANEVDALVAPKSEEPYEGDGKALFRVARLHPLRATTRAFLFRRFLDFARNDIIIIYRNNHTKCVVARFYK